MPEFAMASASTDREGRLAVLQCGLTSDRLQSAALVHMLPPGSRLGSYELITLLGAGGMGEVYRARDLKLGREVAIKVLPELFAADPERLGRFQREAQVLASLNHPNIAAIHGLEESDSIRALVLELVTGATLAERIAGGGIPLDEALAIARQIAAALEAAHEQGIIHRDLKPANIKVTADGVVKVLDFGLAKLIDSRSGTSNPAAAPLSPTITSPGMVTGVGIILGTAAYMAPEQARGKAVDKRADIWAFGAVLYEMLTGRRAFEGEGVTDTLAKILQAEPRWDDVPHRARRLIQRCLEKDPKSRLRDIGDAWDLLQEQPSPTSAVTRPSALPWVVTAAVALAAAVALWALWKTADSTLRPLVRLDVDVGPDLVLPPPDFNRTVAITRDGTRIAYVASVAGGSRRLYTRRLDQRQATALAGTDDADGPMFSPDGQWIGFLANRVLNKVSVDGGPIIPVVHDLNNYAGAAWADDGSFVIGHAITTGLTRTSPDGNGSQSILGLTAADFVFRFPDPLPHGRAVLFASPDIKKGQFASIKVEAVLLDGHRKVLIPGGSAPRAVPSGHLLYIADGTLFAVAFDSEQVETRGVGVPVVNSVASRAAYGSADYDISDTGTLVYREGRLEGDQSYTFEEVDPSSRTPLSLKPDLYLTPTVSRDGSKIAFVTGSGASAGLWVYGVARGTRTRVPTTNIVSVPQLTPDGRYIIYGTVTDQIMYAKADGSAEPSVLFTGRGVLQSSSISADSSLLAIVSVGKGAGALPQISVVPLKVDTEGLTAGTPVRIEGASGFDPRFSPDTKWIAYESDESGQPEVYVRAVALPGGSTGDRWLISNAGGQDPRWRPDRNELRALVITTVGGPAAPPPPQHTIVFLQNFFDELRRRVPTH